MKKSLILNLISKYNINKIESVKWHIKDSELKTNIVSERDNSMIGEIKIFNFKSNYDDVELGIYTTSKLAKLLGALSDEISFDVEKVGDKPIGIKLSDGKSQVYYALCDLAIIPRVPKPKYIPSEFGLAIKIDSEFCNTYNKALSALNEVVLFSVEPGKKQNTATITLGQTDVNTDRFIMNVDAIRANKMTKLYFNAQILSEILQANRGVDSVLEVSEEGLARIKFETEEYSALYYLVGKKEE